MEAGFGGPETIRGRGPSTFQPAPASGPATATVEEHSCGRAIAGLVLAILALPAMIVPPLGVGLAFVALMLAADAWEDIERDPQLGSRNLAVITFWIVGVLAAVGALGAIAYALVG